MHTKEFFMKQALKEAQKAYDIGEIPIGAVVVKDDKVIARAHNLRETKNMSTAHSEILAIEKACKKLNAWRLSGCDLYVTVEPCPMCAGAVLNARMNKVYFGTTDEKSGAVVSKTKLLSLDGEFCNHKAEYEAGVLDLECKNLLQDFFSKLRKK